MMAAVRELVGRRRQRLRLRLPIRLGPLWSQLVERSLLLLGSVALARLLGFGFSIVAARALGPAGFGLVTFTLTLANLGSVALFNSPAGLSRALVRSTSVSDQQVVVSNYLVVIGVLLLASMVAAVPLGLVAGLRGWVLAGLLANLLGIIAIAVYREMQRGVERFGAVAAYNVACNLVQLVAVAGFWFLGLKEPALYIIAFGLSSVAAIAVVRPWAPMGLRPSLGDVNRERIVTVVRFVAPMVVQTAFFMVWLNADVVALRAFGNLTAVGEYGAAKSLANVTLLIPSAVATVLLPHAARVATKEARAYFVRLLVPVCAASLPPLVAVAVLGPWILQHVFGAGYAPAGGALVVLALGMMMYGITLTMDASWTAMNRPKLVMLATAASTPVSIIVLAPLVLQFGMIGAAGALTVGAAVKLAILALVSLGTGAPRARPQQVAA
jgi:O-antigen/teichoic acid export membrane protein